jgi:hypothetical protein
MEAAVVVVEEVNQSWVRVETAAVAAVVGPAQEEFLTTAGA